MASIEFCDVIKHYGKGKKQHTAIHGINAQIHDGEFMVIVGPSGCGKSTLLRMVAGLEQISAGSISIAEKQVNNLEPAQRDIAMVFQNYALYPHMTVFNNMAYGLKNAKVAQDEIAQRVNKAAQTLELEHVLQRKPNELSGGQRQRVAMGRAIVRKPKVFLFDEPLSNLDAKLRASTRLEIQKLHQELGITSLFVTHDQVEAMTLGQRLMVMNAGRVEQIGTPEEIYYQPASTFVASFIGAPSMNLLEDMPNIQAGLTLGIRPEHLQISDAGWLMHIQAIEMLGAERLLYGALFDEQGAAIIVRIPATQIPPSVGTQIHIRPLPNTEHYFDTSTGLRHSN